MDLPTISVCLLVYDELPFLRPWFDRVRGWATQIVAMDTGSKDGTREWITDHLGSDDILITVDRGVVEQNGFADCRNQMTAKATSMWVYHLDADEALSWPQTQKVREHLAKATSSLLSVTTRTFNTFPEIEQFDDWDAIEHVALKHTEPRAIHDDTHRRIYLRDSSFVFRGYIHEELHLGCDNAASYAHPSGLIHNHFSYYRNPQKIREKYRQWARMLLRAEREKSLQDGTNNYWFNTFIPKYREELERQAAWSDEEIVANV